MGSIIILDHISFSVQTSDIIRNISYRFRERKVTVLVGPSGGGKSTLLKLAAGLLIPSSGSVYFWERDIALMNRKENLNFRKSSAFVFQDSALWANQSLYQSLELPLKLHFPDMQRKDRDLRIREILSRVGYKRELSIRPSELSMGEQKLIACARAMLCHPNLYFLDELTESLDDLSDQRLVNIIKSFKQEYKTIILVSHEFKVIKELADYVVVIAGGRFIQEFPIEDIQSNSDLIERLGGVDMTD
ncbi:MAG: ATP-binding cassette domain-containing protein [Spirochaetaceae bacterium]|jgi:ABC-type multidrug transport system ATPase subunit|nr:ATP-binding cassette domain-containing protein [Spirochaetaceae bacterium]